MKRSPPIGHSASSLRSGSPGFSLVELLVGSALLVLTGFAMASILQVTFRFLNQSGEGDAMTAAVNADQAQIEKLNTYYACPSGSCSLPSPLPVNPPTKFQYAPSPTLINGNQVDLSAIQQFASLCRPANAAAAQLVDNLITAIQALPIPVNPPSTPLFSREVEAVPTNFAEQTHLYRVRWYYREPGDPAGELPPKRQILLTPTVAAWCP
jgi:hypothetical protein